MFEFSTAAEQAARLDELIGAAVAADEEHHVTACIAAAAAECRSGSDRQTTVLLAGLAARSARDLGLGVDLRTVLHCVTLSAAVIDTLGGQPDSPGADAAPVLTAAPTPELASWLRARAAALASYASEAELFLSPGEHAGLLVLIDLAGDIAARLGAAPEDDLFLPLPARQADPSVFAQAMWILAGALYDAAERGRSCSRGPGPSPVCDQFVELAFGLLRSAVPFCPDEV